MMFQVLCDTFIKILTSKELIPETLIQVQRALHRHVDTHTYLIITENYIPLLTARAEAKKRVKYSFFYHI